MEVTEAPDVWSDVVGQPGAVARLVAAAASPVHAYLLVGPPGSGKRAAARAFAALVLSADDGAADARRHVELALSEAHPDLRVVEPEGATVRVEEAEALIRAATRSPVEGRRKVVLGLGLEAIQPPAVGMLLKVVEEPPASTVFVLTAAEVTPELVTIASRCALVELAPVAPAAIAERLADEGVEPGRAAAVAALAGGDLARARLLAADDRVALRHAFYRELPGRLDGTGARAAELAAEVAGQVDSSMEALQARLDAEATELQERIERYGQRGSGKKELEDRHKREQRRHRTAELRLALATLAGVYRDALPTAARPGPIVDAVGRIEAAALALERNPNEALLLQSLLVGLPSQRA
ncbi:MAG: ATP-binding protein [Acidimicrobiia bacterium]